MIPARLPVTKLAMLPANVRHPDVENRRRAGIATSADILHVSVLSRRIGADISAGTAAVMAMESGWVHVHESPQ